MRKTRQNDKIRSITTAPAPKLDVKGRILREVFDTAKAQVGGGIVFFYAAGDFALFAEDARRVARCFGIILDIPAPTPGGNPKPEMIVVDGDRINWMIDRLRLAGLRDLWIWNRCEGVKPVMPVGSGSGGADGETAAVNALLARLDATRARNSSRK